MVLCSTGLSSGLGYYELARTTQENAAIRIDRAARSAVAILCFGTDHAIRPEYDADERPVALRMVGKNMLTPEPAALYEDLLDAVGHANQGSANLFRWSAASSSFERFATPFVLADGAPDPGFTIKAGHPAFDSLSRGKPFTGNVPVQGRFRLAYLTPLLDLEGRVAGAFAIDIGWTDDLTEAEHRLQERMMFIAVIILTGAALFGTLLLRIELHPLRQIAKAANELAGGNQLSLFAFSDRKDEIGDLAHGLERVTDLQDKLQKLAYIDPVTTAGNRTRYFLDLSRALHLAKTENICASLLHVDFKGFSKINDTFGQHIGNRILLQTYARLASVFGPRAQIARISGDDFCIVLPFDSGGAIAEDYAQNVVDVFSAPFHINEIEILVEPRIGIALLPQDGADAETAHRVASLALRAACDSDDKGYQFFSAPLNERIQSEMQIETCLRAALKNRHLKLFYQPQINPADGQMIGLEALIRWPNDDDSFISPADFIPIAEKTGLIFDLGNFVLDEACRQAASWVRSGIDFGHVSVNVSPLQFRQPSFASTVKQCLSSYSLAPHRLCLEVTENVFVDTGEQLVLDILSELDAIGVQLSLDDFGSGYSSLMYLHSLPFRELKIDRAFLTDAHKHPQKEHLFQAIVGLGRSLGLRVIAEGAETADEYALAAIEGCDGIQGFYFSPAVDATQLPEIIERFSRYCTSDTGQLEMRRA